MKALIIQNTSTALREPDLYTGQDLHLQIKQVLNHYHDVPQSISFWLEETMIDMENEGALQIVHTIIDSNLKGIHEDLKSVPFVVMSDNHVSKLQYFLRTPKLCKYFVLGNFPKQGLNNAGRSYMDTLLGKRKNEYLEKILVEFHFRSHFVQIMFA